MNLMNHKKNDERRSRAWRLILLGLGLAFAFGTELPCHARDEAADAFLDVWFRKQSAVQTWSADVVQIRQLKALARPLKTEGKVWFHRPKRFRWQLGDPPRTIALRTEEEMLVIYPRLRRVERYADMGEADPAWKSVLGLLNVGFPQSAEAFDAAYERVSAVKSEGTWRIELRPASAQARRLLDLLRLEIAVDTYQVAATALVFADGSTMRNEFSNQLVNPELSPDLFQPEIPDDFTRSSPLQGKRP